MFDEFDWMPLLVGSIAGVGNAVVQEKLPTTGAFTHKNLIYKALLGAAGLYGEISGKLSTDLSYGLLVSSAALFGYSAAAAIEGGGIAAFGDATDSDSENDRIGFQIAAPHGRWGAPYGVGGTGADNDGYQIDDGGQGWQPRLMPGGHTPDMNATVYGGSTQPVGPLG